MEDQERLFRGLIVLCVLLAVVLVAGWVRGQGVDESAVVRVSSGNNGGSGVIVASNRTSSLVLTNRHVLSVGTLSKHRIRYRDKAWIACEILFCVKGQDVCGLRAGRGDLSTIPILRRHPKVGEDAHALGYPAIRGRQEFISRPCKVIGWGTGADGQARDQLMVSKPAISGMSGGAIVIDGHLAGILWGYKYEETHTRSVYAPLILASLKQYQTDTRIRRPHRLLPGDRRGRKPPPDATPEPPDVPFPEDPGREEDKAKLDQIIVAIGGLAEQMGNMPPPTVTIPAELIDTNKQISDQLVRQNEGFTMVGGKLDQLIGVMTPAPAPDSPARQAPGGVVNTIGIHLGRWGWGYTLGLVGAGLLAWLGARRLRRWIRSETFRVEDKPRAEPMLPVRSDEFGKQLVRLHDAEGRNPFHDATRGRIWDDQGDELARGQDEVAAGVAVHLRDRVNRRFEDVHPVAV